ncbi:MAG: hypothetical protein M3Y60_04860 [Bacteroidota bacterium]|nr:hypothetical protein [Bacteroidota bacterium]
MEIEVFKTNVADDVQAVSIVAHIQSAFKDYTANFDLDDCDRILRVVSCGVAIDVMALLQLLKRFGFDAQVLSDDVPQTHQSQEGLRLDSSLE